MQRNIAIDVLKLILAFMVVGLHARFLLEYSDFYSYLMTQGLFRIAVPLFLLINGYFFYDVLEKRNHLAYIKRIFILYLIWSLLYVFFWIGTPQASMHYAFQLAMSLLIGYHHLWYLVGMIGAAFMLFFLRNVSSRTLLALSVALFLIGVGINYLALNHAFSGSALGNLIVNQPFLYRNFLLLSFPMFAFGYLIRKHKANEWFSTRQSMLLAILGVIALLFEAAGNYHHLDREIGGDNLFCLMWACPAIFITVANMKHESSFKAIALYSTGIYLIHIMVLALMGRFFALPPTALTAATILISTIAAAILIRLNKKVKVLL